MPYKAPHPCGYPNCPNVTRERYCPEHKTIASREYQRGRDPATAVRYGRQWKAIRDLYVSKHPLCQRCLESGRYTPAAEVHHIKPLVDGGSNADENLMSLCKPCHAVLDENYKNFHKG